MLSKDMVPSTGYLSLSIVQGGPRAQKTIQPIVITFDWTITIW